MEKHKPIIVFLTALLLVSCVGCSQNSSTGVSNKPRIIQRSSDQVVQEENIKNYRSFVENVKKGQPDWIEKKDTTTEGDPILTNIKFDGKQVEYTIDNSKNKFTSPSSRGIFKIKCNPIIQSDHLSTGETKYYFSNCDNKTTQVIIYSEHS